MWEYNFKIPPEVDSTEEEKKKNEEEYNKMK